MGGGMGGGMSGGIVGGGGGFSYGMASKAGGAGPLFGSQPPSGPAFSSSAGPS